ncbi:hypothetical protein ACFL6S_20760 [Candidatus Poribacteria bacterium]
MKQGTQEDIRSGLGDVLNRFGVDKDAARKARQELAERIEQPEAAEGQGEVGDQFFVHFYRYFGLVDLAIEDILIPTLKPNEQVVYRRMYHLAFNTRPRCNWCQVSVPDLATACNISEGTVRSGIKGLRAGNCIEMIAKASRHEAPVYRVFLPCEMPQFEDATIEDDEGKEVPVMNGVIFMREEPRPSDFRGLNFRGIKSRPLKSGPLIFEGLNELRGTVLRGLNAESRGLNFEGLSDKLNGDNGLDPLEDEDDPPLNGLNRSEEISLSPDGIVDLFYNTISQEDFSEDEREKAFAVIEKLQTKGKRKYTLEEIAFAAEWIPKNSTDKIRTFGILPSIMGQAMRAKKAADKRHEAEAESEAVREEERRLQNEIEKELEEMTKEERADLEKQARENLSGVNQAFVTEMSIRGKMQEILKQRRHNNSA